jgi:hypothetical protein
MCAICDPIVVDQRIQHPFTPKAEADMECETCGRHISVHPDKIEALVKRQAVAA